MRVAALDTGLRSADFLHDHKPSRFARSFVPPANPAGCDIRQARVESSWLGRNASVVMRRLARGKKIQAALGEEAAGKLRCSFKPGQEAIMRLQLLLAVLALSLLSLGSREARATGSECRDEFGNLIKCVPPPRATALCRDGTFDFGKRRSGACLHHGGVASWL